MLRIHLERHSSAKPRSTIRHKSSNHFREPYRPISHGLQQIRTESSMNKSVFGGGHPSAAQAKYRASGGVRDEARAIPPMVGNHAIITCLAKPNNFTNNRLARRPSYPVQRLTTMVPPLAIIPTRRARRPVRLVARRRIVDPALASRLRGPIPRARAQPGLGSSQPRRGARSEAALGCLGVDSRGPVVV